MMGNSHPGGSSLKFGLKKVGSWVIEMPSVRGLSWKTRGILPVAQMGAPLGPWSMLVPVSAGPPGS